MARTKPRLRLQRTKLHWRRDDKDGSQHHKKKNKKHGKSSDSARRVDAEIGGKSKENSDAQVPSTQQQGALPEAGAVPLGQEGQGSSASHSLSATAASDTAPETHSMPLEANSRVNLAKGSMATSAPASGVGSPNAAVLPGAIGGGVFSLFVLVGLYFLLLRKRRKHAKQSTTPASRPEAGHPGIIGEKADVLTPASAILTRSKPATQHEHISLSMMRPQQGGLSTVNAGLELPSARENIVTVQDKTEVGEARCYEEAFSSTTELLPGKARDSVKNRATYDGEDKEIERCLSYYMNRVRSSGLTEQGAPALDDSGLLSTPSSPDVNDTSTRRSSVKAKSKGLLDRIRKSQTRLDNAALAAARGIDPSDFSRTSQSAGSDRPLSITAPNSLDSTTWFEDGESTCERPCLGHTEPGIPSHWRSSAHLRKPALFATTTPEEYAMRSSPGPSEPHSAFEYSDYSGIYAPEPHASPRVALAPGDISDGHSIAWEDQSPCRSSALSPRRSMASTIRQRSATYSQGIPAVASPASSRKSTKPRVLSTISTQDANDIIRF